MRAPEYPAARFYLPTSAVDYYDPPNIEVAVGGDDGWGWEELEQSIRQHGVRQPIEVAMSRTEIAERGNTRPYAFNGNHRLLLAHRLHQVEIPAVHSTADDAEPLTDAQILSLGGRLA